MLKNLAVMGLYLALAGPFVYGQHQALDVKQTGQPQGNRPSSVAMAVQDNRTRQEQEQRPEKPQWWNKFVSWPEGATATAIILTLAAIVWQAVAATSAARAARDANLHIVRSERAWLKAVVVELVAGKPEEPKTIYVQCRVRNYGKTVARVREMKARWGVGPVNDAQKTWDESLLEITKESKPRWIILPNKNSALHSRVDGFEGAAGETITLAMQPGETQYIHGVIHYWDAFTTAPRLTQFCFRFYHIDELGKQRLGFHPIGDPEFNQQT